MLVLELPHPFELCEEDVEDIPATVKEGLYDILSLCFGNEVQVDVCRRGARGRKLKRALLKPTLGAMAKAMSAGTNQRQILLSAQDVRCCIHPFMACNAHKSKGERQ